MKRKTRILLPLALSVLILSGCGTDNPFASSSDFRSSGSGTKANDFYTQKTEFITNNTDPFIKGKDYYRKVLTNQGQFSAPTFSTTGTMEARMVVIPVVFNTPASRSLATPDNLAKLNKLFFGNAEDTSYWESVRSFYKKSSYGKLNITGEVLDYVSLDTDLEAEESKIKNGASLSDVTASLTKGAYNAAFSGNTPKKKASDYDGDKDGVIDYYWVVYMDEYNQDDSTGLAWAYTLWNNDSSCDFRNYSWASYQFMNNAGTGQIDAHTYIHETGHQMGLDDYYSTDYGEAEDYILRHPDLNELEKTNIRNGTYRYYPRSPLGQLNMMDNNILDHDAFSKYCLGWTTPTIMQIGKEYKLKPFENAGGALLIANDFNGTAFDEYYLVEYYTPTGLNELDADYPYKADGNIQGYTQNGVKIYHVDQRLTKLLYNFHTSEWETSDPIHYYDTPDIPTDTDESLQIVSSNSRSSCRDEKDYALVSLVQASGKTNLMEDHYVPDKAEEKNKALQNMKYSVDDFFTPDSLVFGKDIPITSHEGWKLDAHLEITDMNENGVTLKLVSDAENENQSSSEITSSSN